MKRILVFVLVGVSLPIVVGCTETERRGTLVLTAPNRHMIFNPSYPTYVATTQGRSEWPSTSSNAPPVTYLDYSVSIFDRQNASGRGRDRYRRQFSSTRGGGTRQ